MWQCAHACYTCLLCCRFLCFFLFQPWCSVLLCICFFIHLKTFACVPIGIYMYLFHISFMFSTCILHGTIALCWLFLEHLHLKIESCANTMLSYLIQKALLYTIFYFAFSWRNVVSYSAFACHSLHNSMYRFLFTW